MQTSHLPSPKSMEKVHVFSPGKLRRCGSTAAFIWTFIFTPLVWIDQKWLQLRTSWEPAAPSVSLNFWFCLWTFELKSKDSTNESNHKIKLKKHSKCVIGLGWCKTSCLCVCSAAGGADSAVRTVLCLTSETSVFQLLFFGHFAKKPLECSFFCYTDKCVRVEGETFH